MDERVNRLENKLNFMSQEINNIKENLGYINIDMEKKAQKWDEIINELNNNSSITESVSDNLSISYSNSFVNIKVI